MCELGTWLNKFLYKVGAHAVWILNWSEMDIPKNYSFYKFLKKLFEYDTSLYYYAYLFFDKLFNRTLF